MPHKTLKIYRSEEISQKRYNLNKAFAFSQSSLKISKKVTKFSSGKKFSANEEFTLQRFYEEKIRKFCRNKSMQYQYMVQYGAQMLFKRFYLSYSIMDYHPRMLWRSAIYLVLKIENALGEKLTTFCNKAKETSERMRSAEIILLEGIKFEPVIFATIRGLKGLMLLLWEKINNVTLYNCFCAENNTILFQDANRYLGYVMSTDLPLQFQSGHIAAGVLYLASARNGLQCSFFLRHIVQKLNVGNTINSDNVRILPAEGYSFLSVVATLVRTVRFYDLRLNFNA